MKVVVGIYKNHHRIVGAFIKGRYQDITYFMDALNISTDYDAIWFLNYIENGDLLNGVQK